MLQKPLLTAAIAAVLLSVPGISAALSVPTRSPADARVRYVDYNPADVIQLDAVIGLATHIELEPGERYVFHVYGDSDAYQFTHKGNHLFFKPQAKEANSNLLVITDRRDYAFRITYHDNPKATGLYKLVIHYPEAQAKREAAAQAKRKVDEALRAVGTPVNWKTYTRSGDTSLAPVHAWDDGRQTWLQFAAEAEIPAVYRVTPDGQETIVNWHMADSRTMVLHRTSALWHLRLGDLVTAIHNGGYGKVAPPTHTGTASPQVERIVKGEAPQTLPPAPTIAPEPAPPAAVPAATPVPVAEPQPAPAAPTPVNASASGDMTLMPAQMWEQAGKTYMRFAATQDLPQVRATNASGEVVAPTSYVQPPRTLVLEGTFGKWQLERDGAHLIIINAKDAQ